MLRLKSASDNLYSPLSIFTPSFVCGTLSPVNNASFTIHLPFNNSKSHGAKRGESSNSFISYFGLLFLRCVTDIISPGYN